MVLSLPTPKLPFLSSSPFLSRFQYYDLLCSTCLMGLLAVSKLKSTESLPFSFRSDYLTIYSKQTKCSITRGLFESSNFCWRAPGTITTYFQSDELGNLAMPWVAWGGEKGRLESCSVLWWPWYLQGFEQDFEMCLLLPLQVLWSWARE